MTHWTGCGGEPDAQAPTAVLDGPTTVDYGTDFVLSGVKSIDPDGTIVAYRWTAVSVSGGGLTKAVPVETTTPTLTVTASTAPVPSGSQTYRLVVVDDAGNASPPAEMKVIVQDTQAPTAVLDGPTTVDYGADFTLSGVRSIDPDGTIVAYRWTAVSVSGGGLTKAVPVETTTPTLTVTASTDPVPSGSQTYRLVVVDDAGNASPPAEMKVIVQDTQAPTAVLDGPTTVDYGTDFVLSGVNSIAPGGTIVTYRWTAVSVSGGGLTQGVPVETTTPTLTVTASTDPVPLGNQTYRLVVVDDSGNVSPPAEKTVGVQDYTCLGGSVVVDDTSDTVDATLGDGVCADSLGHCTLRAAIQEANACAGVDVIEVPAGTYNLSLAGANEDAAATGDLDITDDVTIRGVSTAAPVVDAGGLDRVFHVIGGVPITLDNLTLQNGDVTGLGGAVATGGNLALTNVTIQGNHASDHGGAVYVSGASVTISGSDLSDNVSDNYGGALFASTNAVVSIADSTLSKNTCGPYGAAVYGHTGSTIDIIRSVLDGNTGLNANTAGWAAVVAMTGATVSITDSTISNSGTATTPAKSTRGVQVYAGSSLTVTRSIITKNSGGGLSCMGGAACTGLTVTDSAIDSNSGVAVGSFGVLGVGIYCQGPLTVVRSSVSKNVVIDGGLNGTGAGGGIWASGDMTVVNTTISNNSIPNNGVGGAIYYEGGTGSLTNVTIANNSAQYGGGIRVQTGTVKVTNTILSANGSGNCTLGGGATIVSQGHNIEDNTSCAFASTGDKSGTDPQLAPLANNGGPTLTRGLLVGSPAIDAGDGAICAAAPVSGLDQRSVLRNDGACDIGAFEGSVSPTP